MKGKDFYYCYSIPLRDFLSSKGIKYLHYGFHSKTKMTFWVYKSSDILDEQLVAYSKFRRSPDYIKPVITYRSEI